MEKIQECIRNQETRIQAIQLLLYIVDRQPPWTHLIVERPLFSTLIKYLKVFYLDIPFILSSLN